MNRFFSTHAPVSLSLGKFGVQRGTRQVISALDLSAKSGQLHVLRGPNGVGKSSLLLALAGIVPATGALIWDGINDEQDRPDMHLIGHLPAIKPDLTLLENLTFWCQINDGDLALVEPALEIARLDHAKTFPAGILSAGQTRRLSLCRLLVAPRPVWLLDEPTGALDQQGEQWVCELISQQVKAGGLVIAATHLDLPVPDVTSHVLALGEAA